MSKNRYFVVSFFETHGKDGAQDCNDSTLEYRLLIGPLFSNVICVFIPDFITTAVEFYAIKIYRSVSA